MSNNNRIVKKWPEHAVSIFTQNVFRATTTYAFSHRNFQKWSDLDAFCIFLFRNALRATTAFTFSTSQIPKIIRTWWVLTLFISKCTSRHKGVHFFHILTSKSRPELTRFAFFDFHMCFAPQRRALFPHLNFQKWSGNSVFY